jgi:hypothetical protein
MQRRWFAVAWRESSGAVPDPVRRSCAAADIQIVDEEL